MASETFIDDSELVKRHRDFVQLMQSQNNIRSKADNLSNLMMFASEVAAAAMFVALEKPLEDKPLLKWASVFSVGLCGIFAAGRMHEHYINTHTKKLEEGYKGRF